MYFITGDAHRDFNYLRQFCYENHTTHKDVLVLFGDSCLIFYLDERDTELKCSIFDLPITLFCVHGNHEERPYNMPSYHTMEWNKGIVYVEDEFPHILFAKDGEIYHFGNKTVMPIGGAASVDREDRIRNDLEWFESEQPDDTIQAFVEQQLLGVNWRVNYIFTHTVPLPYEPTWAFKPHIDQSKVDKTTERWLEEIERKTTYDEWFAGHFHVDAKNGPINLMYRDFYTLDE